MRADITFLTDDDPEALGRVACSGESRYTLFFTLEDARILSIHMGVKSYRLFQNFIAQMALDDALDELIRE